MKISKEYKYADGVLSGFAERVYYFESDDLLSRFFGSVFRNPARIGLYLINYDYYIATSKTYKREKNLHSKPSFEHYHRLQQQAPTSICSLPVPSSQALSLL